MPRIIGTYILSVFLPLVIGAFIYIFLREQTPIALAYIYSLLSSELDIPIPKFPIIELGNNWNWFIYNLPDGLWAFGFFSFIYLNTRNDGCATKIIYYSLCILIMILIEVQLGTFDWLDIVAMLIGCLSSLGCLEFAIRKYNNINIKAKTDNLIKAS